MASKVKSKSVTVSGLELKNDKNIHYYVNLPGFAYNDFDRHGIISLWAICKLMELNRISFGHEQIPSMTQNNTVGVVSGQIWKIKKELYQKAAISYPIKYIDKAGFLGRNSFTFLLQLYETDTGMLLVENERQIVFIDMNTRKRAPIPMRHVQQRTQPVRPTKFHIETPEQPSGAYIFYLEARYSDYDHLQHVNACSYVKWIIDAASEAAALGKLKNFSTAFNYCAEEVQILYMNECYAGDKIKVNIWEVDCKKKIGFHVQKLTNTNLVSAVRGIIKFYNTTFQSLL